MVGEGEIVDKGRFCGMYKKHETFRFGRLPAVRTGLDPVTSCPRAGATKTTPSRATSAQVSDSTGCRSTTAGSDLLYYHEFLEFHGLSSP